jgi:hypothetical protein
MASPYTEAADAVADVPTDFTYQTEHADSPQKLQNAIWSYTNSGLWSVSDLEGEVGLPYRSANDPRVPYTDTEDTGLDLITPQFNLDKYPGASAPVPVADGIEARLIEAEAQLQASTRSGMTAILNDLRQTAISPALPNLSTPREPGRGHRPAFLGARILALCDRPPAGRHAAADPGLRQGFGERIPDGGIPQERNVRPRREPADPDRGAEQLELARVHRPERLGLSRPPDSSARDRSRSST